MGQFIIRKGSTDFQFVNYAYEKLIREYLRKNLNSFDVFIDVGACIGEYCIWLANKGKTCYAFEPVPKNYDALKRNVELNNVQSSIHDFNLGLGSSDEKLLFEVMDTVTGSSRANPNLKSGGVYVPIKRMDDVLPVDVLDGKSRVVMKMDVEGMEIEVLKGASDFLSRIDDLRIIYEHTFAGDNSIKSYLLDISEFSFTQLDEYNIMAKKL